ncbi:hypothetical protein BKA70DRAFT_1432445 [Coprinopsis sp. MPI-PUGE-AT-0042]|nr:hypothetical protein BKA70DRAFT_1432445 [Coprinopsis sp. MPI-PUGE-AT-0042]
MGHHRWTDDHEGALDFLSDMLPDYILAQEQKKPLKDGFYRNATAKFKAKFPQVPTSQEIQKYGQEQAQEIVDKRLFSRICQWFPNNTRPGSRVCRLAKFESPPPQLERPESRTRGRRSRQKFSQSCIQIMPAKRKLQPLQAYSKLFFKDDVRDAYLAARDKYVEECKSTNTAPSQEIAFRNQWLKERLESESDEVKTQVEEYRRSESKETGDEDSATRNGRFARNIPKLPKTLEGICQSIHDETGFVVSITVGGPHPMYGGKLVTLSRHFGKTHSGQTYEEFVGETEYDHQLAAFDDFLQEKFDESDRKECTLDTKEGPVKYHDIEDASDNEDDDAGEDGDEEEDDEQGRSTETNDSKLVAKQPKRSATGQLSEYELAREKKIAENQALIATLGLNRGASKTITSTSAKVDKRPKKKTADRPGGTQGEDVSEKDRGQEEGSSSSRSISDLPSTPSPTSEASKTTPKPVVNTIDPPSTTSTDLSTGGGDANGVGAAIIAEEPGAGSNGNGVNMSSDHDVTEDVEMASMANKTTQKPDGAPSKESELDKSQVKPVDPAAIVADTDASNSTTEYPIPPHLASLWEYLVGINALALWKDLLHCYLKFESTAPPSGSMPTTVRPSEVALWMKRHRKAATPREVEREDFGPRVLTWWHALQPTWRIPASTSTPGMYKRDEEGSLDCLRKGGPSGIFLIVLAIGWWISAHGDEEISAGVTEILEDVTWVLTQLSGGTTSSTTTIQRNDAVSTGRPQRGAKRKVDNDSTALKRRRL